MQVPSCSSESISLETTRSIAIQALALTVQDWNTMGQSSDPTVSEASLFSGEGSSAEEEELLRVFVNRVTSLLMIRLVAIRLHQESLVDPQFQLSQPFLDISTSSICRQALIADELPWPFITEQILDEMQQYVQTILQNYSPTLPFHNRQHAVTVVVNCNKLMDMIVANDYYNDVVQYDIDGRRPPTFGLRNDPALLLSLMFAAFIHDVQHEGVLNSQLVRKDHPSALLYNDQSVQEKRSLQFAFETLLLTNYSNLRGCMFAEDANYRYFRTAVISAVMSTDLASPEQMVLMKSKWKEAFYQTPAAEEPVTSNSPGPLHQPGRRSSALSNISMPRYTAPGASNHYVIRSSGNGFNRRGSNYSEMSEITTDFMSPVGDYQNTTHSPRRRFSADMEYNSTNMPSSSYQQTPRRRYMPRRCSNASETSSDGAESNELAVDSVALMYQRRNRVRTDEVSVDSVVSDTVDSCVLHKKKPLNELMDIKKSGTTKATDKEPTPCDAANLSIKDGESVSRVRSSINSEQDGSTSLVSYPVGSIAVNQKRLEGAPKTRRRTLPMTKKEPCDTGSNKDVSSEPDGSTSLVSYPAGSIAVIQKRLDGAPKTRRRANLLDAGVSADGADGTPKDECVRPANARCVKSDVRRGRTPNRRIQVDSDECSFSLTPPSSDDESDKRKMVIQAPMGSSNGIVSTAARRASTGAISRFGSVAEQRIDENHSNHDESQYNDFIRQSKSVDFDLELPSNSPMKFRKRLGIRRSMDLSGEAIEFYSKRSSIGNMSSHSGTLGEIDNDEVDYMKASAVIEALLRLADVGHFYQNWQNMTDWSSRMFRERTRNAPNPEKRQEIAVQWFDNQIRIIDSYLKPLALQLDESGVFGEFNGAIFAQNVDEIRNHWMIYGFEWTEKLIQSEGL